MHTTRRNFLQTSLLAIAATGAARTAFAAFDVATMFSGKIETVRLEDDFRVLIGAGGNVSVHFDAEHLLVVDSGVPARGAEVLAAATTFAPSAARKTLFDTHWHFDHAGGNETFVKAGFTVIGSTACRERLGQTIVFEDMNKTSTPIPEPARPSVTFDTTLNLFEASPVRLIKVAPAHTDTDAIAFFEKANVLVAGDLFFSGVFPVIDRSSGGSLDGMIAASKQLLALGDDKTRVVPGHGPVGDKAPLRAQFDLLNLTHDRLAPFGDKKASLDDVLAANPLADLDDKWGRGLVRSPLFTRMAYGQWVKR